MNTHRKPHLFVIALLTLLVSACAGNPPANQPPVAMQPIDACCELPGGACIAVSRGADGSAECAKHGGTHHPDKTCINGICSTRPVESKGCCQYDNNCAMTSKDGCLGGTWSTQWICRETRCTTP